MIIYLVLQVFVLPGLLMTRGVHRLWLSRMLMRGRKKHALGLGVANLQANDLLVGIGLRATSGILLVPPRSWTLR